MNQYGGFGLFGTRLRELNELAQGSPQQRAHEEQAFYDRFGEFAGSDRRWLRAAAISVAGIAVAALSLGGVIVNALR